MTDIVKLKVLGRLQADSSPENMRDLSTEFEIPYSRLIKWRKELNKSIETGDMELLVNADKVMVHRIAEETKRELEELAPGVVIEGDVDKVVEKIDNLTILSETMQKTALKLAIRIDTLSFDMMDPKGLNSLVISLSALQMAFFNKQTTQVNVQNNSYTSDKVAKFNKLKKS